MSRKHFFDFFKNVRHPSIGVDPFESSQFIKVFDNRHRVSVMADKSSFQDLEAVALSASAQAAIDASLLVAVQEENKLCRCFLSYQFVRQ
jgi:hypothetical protein